LRKFVGAQPGAYGGHEGKDKEGLDAREVYNEGRAPTPEKGRHGIEGDFGRGKIRRIANPNAGFYSLEEKSGPNKKNVGFGTKKERRYRCPLHRTRRGPRQMHNAAV